MGDEKDGLTKTAFQEVSQLIRDEFIDFKEWFEEKIEAEKLYNEMQFQKKNDCLSNGVGRHEEVDKKLGNVYRLIILAIGMSAFALGARAWEIVHTLLSVIK